MNTIKVAHTVSEQYYHVIGVGKFRLARQWDWEFIPLTERVECPVCGKMHIVAPYIYQAVEDKYDMSYEEQIYTAYEKTCSIECAFIYREQHRDILASDTL